jgi:16S rRNA (guanine527-N7)-methyltransferase
MFHVKQDHEMFHVKHADGDAAVEERAEPGPVSDAAAAIFGGRVDLAQRYAELLGRLAGCGSVTY